jgi:hypothetical protein
MGAALEKPDIQAVLDRETDTALLRLHFDIVIPRNRCLEPAILMDQEHFADGACRSFPLQPRRS